MKKVVAVRSEAIQERLLRLHMTRARLAALVGVSRNYVVQLMKGARFPSAPVRAKIASVLGEADFDALFVIVERPSSQEANQ